VFITYINVLTNTKAPLFEEHANKCSSYNF